MPNKLFLDHVGSSFSNTTRDEMVFVKEHRPRSTAWRLSEAQAAEQSASNFERCDFELRLVHAQVIPPSETITADFWAAGHSVLRRIR